MGCDVAGKLRLAFLETRPPAFEEFLEPIMYCRADDEPVVFAREIYPCANLEFIDRGKLDEVICHLASEAYAFVIPRTLIYLLENEEGFDENFLTGLMSAIDVSPANPDGNLVRKASAFYCRLTPSQRDAIRAAYRKLSEHPDVGNSDRRVWHAAACFLESSS